MNIQGGKKFDAKQKQSKTNNDSRVYYLYTGTADVEILKVCPTREELIELKNIPEDRQDKVRVPNYRTDDGQRVSVLCRIEPRKLMHQKAVDEAMRKAAADKVVLEDKDLPKLEDFSKYQNEYFFDFSFYISNNEITTKLGKKMFGTRDMKTVVAEDYDALIARGTPKFIFENRKFVDNDGEEVEEAPVFRTLMYGEMTLLSLMYAASNVIHTRNNEGTFMFAEDEEAHKEVFADICSGDFDMVNDFLESDFCKDDEGNRLKVGMFLTVREGSKSDSQGVPYYNQDVFLPYGGKGFEKEGRGLTRDTTRAIADDRCSKEYQGSLEFLPFDRVAHYKSFEDASADSQTEADEASMLNVNDSALGDDLPF